MFPPLLLIGGPDLKHHNSAAVVSWCHCRSIDVKWKWNQTSSLLCTNKRSYTVSS